MRAVPQDCCGMLSKESSFCVEISLANMWSVELEICAAFTVFIHDKHFDELRGRDWASVCSWVQEHVLSSPRPYYRTTFCLTVTKACIIKAGQN